MLRGGSRIAGNGEPEVAKSQRAEKARFRASRPALLRGPRRLRDHGGGLVLAAGNAGAAGARHQSLSSEDRVGN